MMGQIGEIKLDPASINFKTEYLNTEEGERNMTCAIKKKDPLLLMKLTKAVFVCMSDKANQITKFNEVHGACMGRKAREEEVAYDKEHAAKKA